MQLTEVLVLDVVCDCTVSMKWQHVERCGWGNVWWLCRCHWWCRTWSRSAESSVRRRPPSALLFIHMFSDCYST